MFSQLSYGTNSFKYLKSYVYYCIKGKDGENPRRIAWNNISWSKSKNLPGYTICDYIENARTKVTKQENTKQILDKSQKIPEKHLRTMSCKNNTK